MFLFYNYAAFICIFIIFFFLIEPRHFVLFLSSMRKPLNLCRRRHSNILLLRQSQNELIEYSPSFLIKSRMYCGVIIICNNDHMVYII